MIHLLNCARFLLLFQSGDHHFQRKYQQVQLSRKMGCPAKIYVYEHIHFPAYPVSKDQFVDLNSIF